MMVVWKVEMMAGKMVDELVESMAAIKVERLVVLTAETRADAKVG